MVKGETSEVDKYNDLKGAAFKEYDIVTLLPSVSNFKKIAQEKIKYSIENNVKSALILFDIDNFKHVNDSYGHEFGDNMLRMISGEIRESFNDNIIMCRYSGNTFILFIDNLNDKNDINTIIRRVFDVFKKPHNEIYLTISMGVAVIPKDGQKFDNLLKNADIAMYEVKQNGKNKYEFFDSEMENKLIEEYELQKELRTSLEKKEMYVVYQPKVFLDGSIVKGFEALVRWTNGKFGQISPVKFIPLAEQSRMIVPIGNFVLEEVCKKIKYLISNGYEDFKIAVNLSEVQFQEGILVDILKDLIRNHLPTLFFSLELSKQQVIDKIAATIILQSYLDRRNNER